MGPFPSPCPCVPGTASFYVSVCMCVCVCVVWFLPACVVYVCDAWRCVGPHNTVLLSQHFYNWNPWLLCGVQGTLTCTSPSFRRWPEQVPSGAGSGPGASQEAPGGGVCPGVHRGWLLHPGRPWLLSRALGAGGPREPCFLETDEGSVTPPVLPLGPVSPSRAPLPLGTHRWQWVLKGLCEIESGDWHCSVPVLPLPVFIFLFCQM